jgi:hypothetical protein
MEKVVNTIVLTEWRAVLDTPITLEEIRTAEMQAKSAWNG